MSNIVRVILTYTNPTKLDMLHLSHLIYRSPSILDQKIYIASPRTDLLYYSSDRLSNIKLCQALSVNEISSEYLDKYKKIQEKSYFNKKL